MRSNSVVQQGVRMTSDQQEASHAVSVRLPQFVPSCDKAVTTPAFKAFGAGPSARFAGFGSALNRNCDSQARTDGVNRHGASSTMPGVGRRAVRPSPSLLSQQCQPTHQTAALPAASSYPDDPELTIGCVKGGEAISAVTSKTPFTRPVGRSDTAEQ